MSAQYKNFVVCNSKMLATVIRHALAAERPPEDVRRAAETILDEWNVIKSDASPTLEIGETEFWCAVWTAQHLGDKEHWKDGTGPRDLQLLLSALEGKGKMPEGWRGSRP